MLQIRRRNIIRVVLRANELRRILWYDCYTQIVNELFNKYCTVL